MTNTCRFIENAETRAGSDISDLVWPNDPAEIPDWVYTDQRIYDLEQERIFLGRSWSYVAL